jgi:hypothetical protein
MYDNLILLLILLLLFVIQGSQKHPIFGQMPDFEDFARFSDFGEEDLGALLFVY